MARLDEALGELINIEVILKAQQDIQRILTARVSSDDKLGEVSNILEAAHNNVRDDYQAYGLFNSAIKHHSVFQNWLANLPKGQQTVFSKLLTAMLPPKDIQQKPILPSELEFKAQNFKDKVKSGWLKTQESSGQSEAYTQVARLVEEFILQERVNISIAATSNSIFFDLLHDNKVSEKDKSDIQAYLDIVAEQRANYDNLRLHELLMPPNKPLNEMVTRISQVYQSADYKKYQDTLEDIMPHLVRVQAITAKYAQPQLSSVLMQQMSVSASYPRIFKALDSAIKQTDLSAALVTEALQTAQKRKASVDAIYDFNQVMSTVIAGKEQTAILNHLILKSPPALSREATSIHQRGVFLEHMLTKGFPDVFESLDRGIKVNGKQVNLIYAALGGKPASGESLNPYKFDAEKLSNLGKNPVWSVLKAIKPVDETFTLVDKANAYHTLITMAKSGELKISNQGVMLQANEIAQRLLDMVNERIKTNRHEATPALQSVMVQIYDTIRTGQLTRGLTGRSMVEMSYKEIKKQGFKEQAHIKADSAFKEHAEAEAVITKSTSMSSMSLPSQEEEDASVLEDNTDEKDVVSLDNQPVDDKLASVRSRSHSVSSVIQELDEHQVDLGSVVSAKGKAKIQEDTPLEDEMSSKQVVHKVSDEPVTQVVEAHPDTPLEELKEFDVIVEQAKEDKMPARPPLNFLEGIRKHEKSALRSVPVEEPKKSPKNILDEIKQGKQLKPPPSAEEIAAQKQATQEKTAPLGSMLQKALAVNRGFIETDSSDDEESDEENDYKP